MARIQVLPLTTQTVGTVSDTPFVIVIDRLEGEDLAKLLPLGTESSGLRRSLGARAVLVFDGELTVANVDQALHDAACAAVERALTLTG